MKKLDEWFSIVCNLGNKHNGARRWDFFVLRHNIYGGAALLVQKDLFEFLPYDTIMDTVLDRAEAKELVVHVSEDLE